MVTDPPPRFPAQHAEALAKSPAGREGPKAPGVMATLSLVVRRLNFTLRHLDVTCEAYDHFRAWLRRLEGLAGGRLRFAVEPVDASFPQLLVYERIQQLVGAPAPGCWLWARPRAAGAGGDEPASRLGPARALAADRCAGPSLSGAVNGHPALGHVLSPRAVRTPGEAGKRGRGRLVGPTATLHCESVWPRRLGRVGLMALGPSNWRAGSSHVGL